MKVEPVGPPIVASKMEYIIYICMYHILVTAVKVVQAEPPLVASPTPPLLPRTGTDLLFGRYQVILMMLMMIMI